MSTIIVTLDEATAKHGSCDDFRFCRGEEDVLKIRSIDIPHIIQRLQYHYESYQILEQEHWDKMQHNHGDNHGSFTVLKWRCLCIEYLFCANNYRFSCFVFTKKYWR